MGSGTKVDGGCMEESGQHGVCKICFFTFVNGIVTLKCDNFFVELLFLISFAPLRSL
jgi:hypothetical protein